MTVFEVNDVHYTSKRSDITDNGPFECTYEDESKLRSLIFAATAFNWPHRIRKQAKMSDRNFDSSS